MLGGGKGKKQKRMSVQPRVPPIGQQPFLPGNSGRCPAIKFRTVLKESGPGLAEIGQTLVDFGPTSAESGLIWAEPGCSEARCWSRCGQFRTILGTHWPKSDNCGWRLAGTGVKLGDSGPKLDFVCTRAKLIDGGPVDIGVGGQLRLGRSCRLPSYLCAGGGLPGGALSAGERRAESAPRRRGPTPGETAERMHGLPLERICDIHAARRSPRAAGLLGVGAWRWRGLGGSSRTARGAARSRFESGEGAEPRREGPPGEDLVVAARLEPKIN